MIQTTPSLDGMTSQRQIEAISRIIKNVPVTDQNIREVAALLKSIQIPDLYYMSKILNIFCLWNNKTDIENKSVWDAGIKYAPISFEYVITRLKIMAREQREDDSSESDGDFELVKAVTEPEPVGSGAKLNQLSNIANLDKMMSDLDLIEIGTKNKKTFYVNATNALKVFQILCYEKRPNDALKIFKKFTWADKTQSLIIALKTIPELIESVQKDQSSGIDINPETLRILNFAYGSTIRQICQEKIEIDDLVQVSQRYGSVKKIEGDNVGIDFGTTNQQFAIQKVKLIAKKHKSRMDPQVDDIVTRGPDWHKYDNRIGVVGDYGVVVSIETSQSTENIYTVKWINGYQNKYVASSLKVVTSKVPVASCRVGDIVATKDNYIGLVDSREQTVLLLLRDTNGKEKTCTISIIVNIVRVEPSLFDKNPQFGDIVIKGLDWYSGYNMGDAFGIISRIDNDKLQPVKWNTGSSTYCRMGRGTVEKYDAQVVGRSIGDIAVNDVQIGDFITLEDSTKIFLVIYIDGNNMCIVDNNNRTGVRMLPMNRINKVIARSVQVEETNTGTYKPQIGDYGRFMRDLCRIVELKENSYRVDYVEKRGVHKPTSENLKRELFIYAGTPVVYTPEEINSLIGSKTSVHETIPEIFNDVVHINIKPIVIAMKANNWKMIEQLLKSGLVLTESDFDSFSFSRIRIECTKAYANEAQKAVLDKISIIPTSITPITADNVESVIAQL